MNFLNVGPLELMVILVIAILVVGPKRMVETVQAIRRLAGKLRGLSGEFTSMIQQEVRSAERAVEGQEEAEGAESSAGGNLGSIIRDGLAPIQSIQAELRATAQEARQALDNVIQEDLMPIANIPAELQAEVQGIAQETRQALEDTVQEDLVSIASIPADLQTEIQDAAQKTRRVVQNVDTTQQPPSQASETESDDLESGQEAE